MAVDTKQARDEAMRRLIEATAQHSSYLHRAATATVNKVHKAIDEAGNELSRELGDRLDNLTPAELAAFTSGKYTTDRLKGLRNAINRWAERLGNEVTVIFEADGLELADHEAGYIAKSLNAVLEDSVEQVVAGATAYSAAMSQPVLGELVGDMLADLPETTRRQVYATVRQGIAEGQTTGEIVRALRGAKALNFKDGILQVARNSAERIVRTGRNHISNVAYRETYAALDVTEVVWTSTLDGRTSKVCASRDGERYKVAENHPSPPAHPNCRSVLLPSFDDDIMGKRPYVRAFKPVGQIPKDQRPADMIGQVSAKTNYAKFFANQPAWFQKEWLGPTRYKLYKQGGYSIDRFVDPQGKEYTVADLRARDAQTFAELFG